MSRSGLESAILPRGEAKQNKSVILVSASFLLILVAVFGLASPSRAQEQTGAPQLSSPKAGASIGSPRPQIVGAAAGQEVLVFIDGTLNGKAKIEAGKFSYQPFLPLASGRHSVRVQNSGGETVLSFNVIPNPAPTLLAPKTDARLGQDRIWVGGVARNDSWVRVLVDGQEKARVKAANHKSGTGSFGAKLSGLSLGEHTITAIARDQQGKDSFLSKPLRLNVLPATPAPVLKKPVVNADAGIERPFIVGLAKNNLVVSIVIDDKIVATLGPKPGEKGVAAFAWQPSVALGQGTHRIEAFAADANKLSNNSKAIYWPVGELAAAGGAKDSEGTRPESGSGQKGGNGPLNVAPPPAGDDSPALVFPGRVLADDENKVAQAPEPGENTQELAPGAVAKTAGESGPDGPSSSQSRSLLIGLVILALLILSIAVWYIQERRGRKPAGMAGIFRELEESEKSAAERKDDNQNLPPPPPMF